MLLINSLHGKEVFSLADCLHVILVVYKDVVTSNVGGNDTLFI